LSAYNSHEIEDGYHRILVRSQFSDVRTVCYDRQAFFS